MKSAWTVLIISALTDFIITAGAVISASNDFNTRMWIFAAVGGLVAGARTVQQALKATPETTAELKGEPPSGK